MQGTIRRIRSTNQNVALDHTYVGRFLALPGLGQSVVFLSDEKSFATSPVTVLSCSFDLSGQVVGAFATLNSVYQFTHQPQKEAQHEQTAGPFRN